MRSGIRALFPALALSACLTPYEARHDSGWESKDQVWMSESSQLKLRAAQSRLFETTDRTAILAAVIATLQDLGFMIEVLDEDLGIVSGQLFVPIERSTLVYDPAYHLYDDYSLMIFSRAYLGWGAFHHRDDLVRVTVTVRQRNASQSIVRASAQHYLRAVEDPEPYQRFFRALSQALFLDAMLLSDDD